MSQFTLLEVWKKDIVLLSTDLLLSDVAELQYERFLMQVEQTFDGRGIWPIWFRNEDNRSRFGPVTLWIDSKNKNMELLL